jgi:hypothetical protein
MKKYSVLVFIFLFCMTTVALPAEARRISDGEWKYDSTLSKKVKKLSKKTPAHFPLPILFGKSVAQVTPDFGSPRGGGTRTHEGQDIIAPKGTPIISPTEAVVLSVGEGDSAGKYVRTANPGGLTLVYMHLDTIAKIKSGEVLKVGELIGTVGDTGNAKGITPHLHFEVRKDGALDPYPFLEDSLTLEEKTRFLSGVIKKAKNKNEMVTFLVSEYGEVLTEALGKAYAVPKEIEKLLIKTKKITSVADLQKHNELVARVPHTLLKNLSLGDEGSEVRLLQQYLVTTNTKESAGLAATGPTGYFGPVTERALRGLQKKLKIKESGVWDTETRIKLQN